MKKLMLTSLLVAGSALALASCHKGSGKLAGLNLPDTFDETKEYNLSFWSKNDGNNVQKEIYENAVKSFSELYPNIHVELRQFSNYEDIYKDVLLNISTDTTPNVCIAYPDHVATYLAGSNVVADISQIMDQPSYGLGGKDLKYEAVKREDIVDKFLEEGKIGDSYYTLPFVRSTEALYMNEDYLKKIGISSVPEYVSWDWIWDTCEKALKYKEQELKENPDADSLLYPLIYKSTDNMFISMCKQYGYDFTSDSGEVLMFNDDVSNMLVDLGTHATAGHFETFNRVSYPGNFFNKWECLMAVDSTAGSTWMGYDAVTHDTANTAKGEHFNTIVRAIPQVDTNNPQMISQGPSICVFNKPDNQEVIASWIFAQYLLTNDIQLSYSATEGYLPVTKKAMESNQFQSYLKDPDQYSVKLDATKLIMNNIENTFITPVFNGSSNCRSAGNYLIEGIFNKEYKTKESMETLYQRCIKFKDLAKLMNQTTTLEFSNGSKLNDPSISYDSRKIYASSIQTGDFTDQYVVLYYKESKLVGAIRAYVCISEERAEAYDKAYSDMTHSKTLLYGTYTTEEELNQIAKTYGASDPSTLEKAVKKSGLKDSEKLHLTTPSIILLVSLLLIWIGIGLYVLKDKILIRKKR